MPTICFIDEFRPTLYNPLIEAGFSCADYTRLDRERILADLKDYDGLVVRSRLDIDRELLDAGGDKLRVVARWGVGTEHIDLGYARERGITVLTSPEGSKDAVGEHTVGLLLMLLNHLGRADRQVRAGEWIRAGNRGTELGGKTVGLIGYGNMGRATARRLSGFGCTVITHDNGLPGNYGDEFATAVSLAELQERAHIVSLHIPLENNRYYADAAWMNAFAHPFWLINTARGPLIPTADLVANLTSGQILGAALDVIEYEEQSFHHLDPAQMPAPFQKLLELDNVLLTPHIGGWSHEAEAGHARTLAKKLKAFWASPVL